MNSDWMKKGQKADQRPAGHWDMQYEALEAITMRREDPGMMLEWSTGNLFAIVHDLTRNFKSLAQKSSLRALRNLCKSPYIFLLKLWDWDNKL